MRNVFLFLIIPSIVLAGGPRSTFPDPRGLNDEMTNIYHDIANPVINYGTAATLVVTTGTISNLVGTATNNNAITGNVGEYIESLVSNVSFPTSTQFGDATSISLTAGDWDVSAILSVNINGATFADLVYIGISPNSGNNSSGLTTGQNESGVNAGAISGATAVVPSYRVSLSTLTTYYLKFNSNYSVATPKTFGARISARRVR